MNLDAALRELIREWKRIKRGIARLEAQQRNVEQRAKQLIPRSRRGRKMMGKEERLEVSRRMTEYWRTRRAQKREMQRSLDPS